MINIKHGYYAIYEDHFLEMNHSDKGWELISSDLKLIKYGFTHVENYCYKVIKNGLDVSGFYVRTYCYYKNGKYDISNIVNGLVILFPDLETKKKLGFHIYHDESIDIPYDEFITGVEDIWEERTPVEGFKFDVEPIVYLKKINK